MTHIQQVVAQTLIDLGIQTPDGQLLTNIDSLELVRIVLELEDRLTLKQSITNEDTFSPSKSPFRSVETLVEYLEGLV